MAPSSSAEHALARPQHGHLAETAGLLPRRIARSSAVDELRSRESEFGRAAAVKLEENQRRAALLAAVHGRMAQSAAAEAEERERFRVATIGAADAQRRLAAVREDITRLQVECARVASDEAECQPIRTASQSEVDRLAQVVRSQEDRRLNLDAQLAELKRCAPELAEERERQLVAVAEVEVVLRRLRPETIRLKEMIAGQERELRRLGSEHDDRDSKTAELDRAVNDGEAELARRDATSALRTEVAELRRDRPPRQAGGSTSAAEHGTLFDDRSDS